ncbi:MAG: Outer membrane protein assembly factor BamB [Phycisphaerae bacterium]|nr:Outer membrane protein assembly factor BamB [Phycisphaerae bacterium]
MSEGGSQLMLGSRHRIFFAAAFFSIGAMTYTRAEEATDPWPTWQRTNSRLGRTEYLGPRTPTLGWKLRVDPYHLDGNFEYRITLDSTGGLYIGVLDYLVCVDSCTQHVRWSFQTDVVVQNAPVIWRERVFFGTTSADDATFYCLIAETGEEVWRYFVPGGTINSSPAVDANGMVHFSSAKTMYALDADDGSEVWVKTFRESIHSSPALDEEARRFDYVLEGSTYRAFDIVDGTQLWAFPMLGTFDHGTAVIENGRLFTGNFANSQFNRRVYCVDARKGEEIWNAPVYSSTQNVAMGHRGVLYATPSGSFGDLYAFDAATGEVIWRYVVDNPIFDPPVVDGEDSIYFGTPSLPYTVYAVRSDGSELWRYAMPDNVFGSPIIAPDGTLYVMCSDKFLYAFRDPAGDLNYDKVIDLADYAKFDTCMTAPRLWGTSVNTAPRCELLDFNRDWDVDLADYAAFQNVFGTAIP